MTTNKKIIILTLISFITLLNISSLSTYAETKEINTDAVLTAPILDMDSLKIDKSEATPGHTINISFNAYDDVSPISQILICYKKPISNTIKVLHISLERYDTKTEFKIPFTIDDNTECGVWTVNSFVLTNHIGDRTEMHCSSYDFSKLNFNVTNTHSYDKTIPSIKMDDFKIDKTEASPGDILTGSFKSYLDQSEEKRIHLGFKSSISERYKSAVAIYNPSTERYEFILYIKDDMENALWYLSGIEIYDSSYRRNFFNVLSNDFPTVSFNVKNNKDVDIKAPVLDISSVKLNKNSLKLGDTLTISLKAYDDKSGISSADLYYITPVSKQYITIPLSYNSNTKCYEGSLNINDSLINQTGTWKLHTLRLIDNNNNWNFIYDIYEYPFLKGNCICTRYDCSCFSFNVTDDTNICEDLNGDGFVNITDLSMLADNYNKTSKDNGWNSKLDLNKDGIIDIYDIVQVSSKMKN